MGQLIFIFVLICIYFTINGFTAGYYWGDDGLKFGWRSLLFTIIFLLVGAIIVFIDLLFNGLYRLWKKINNIFPFIFYYRFYCTKYYNNLEKHALESYKRQEENVFNKDIRKHRLFRKAVKKIYERNNYNPKENTK